MQSETVLGRATPGSDLIADIEVDDFVAGIQDLDRR